MRSHEAPRGDGDGDRERTDADDADDAVTVAFPQLPIPARSIGEKFDLSGDVASWDDWL